MFPFRAPRRTVNKEAAVKNRTFSALAVLLLALALLLLGVSRGEPELVLQKAVRVCTECIGLG